MRVAGRKKPLPLSMKTKAGGGEQKRGVEGTSSNRTQQSRGTSLWGRRAGLALEVEEARGRAKGVCGGGG